jgi:hypothetical protein
MDFSSIANSVSKDTSAFKKIQSISKMTDINTSSDISSFNSTFRKVNNLYLTQNSIDNNSYFYGTLRQHNTSSNNSLMPSSTSLVDKKSLFKFFSYLSETKPITKPITNTSNINKLISNTTNINSPKPIDNVFSESINNFENFNSVNILTEKQSSLNPLKVLNSSKKRTTIVGANDLYLDELLLTNINNYYS